MPLLHRRNTLLAPLLLLARCGSAPPPPPTLALTVRAGADQNPDPQSRPAPVAIRIYQLGSLGAFERAEVFALMDQEAQTLGPDLVGRDELIVAPGERREQTFDLKPDARFIGAIALFRDIDQATWRIHVTAAASGPTRLILATNRLQLSVSQA